MPATVNGDAGQTVNGVNSYTNYFDYDLAGNPLEIRSSSNNGFDPDNFISSFIDNGTQDTDFTPDGNGNPIDTFNDTYKFDTDNRLTGLSTAGFTANYDPDGLARQPHGPTEQTVYTLTDEDGTPLVEEDYFNNAVKLDWVYAYGPDGLREEYTQGGDFIAVGYDPEGNANYKGLSFDTTTYGTDLVAYDAYGNELIDQKPTGALTITADPAGFAGQWGGMTDWFYARGSSGIPDQVLMTHRYYDPRTGRFVNRDPIGYSGGINLYGYAGNNPITGSDSSGFAPYGNQGEIDGVPYRMDFDEAGGPDMHIYAPGKEVMIKWNGAQILRKGPGGHDTQRLPKGLRAAFKPVIKDFVQRARVRMESLADYDKGARANLARWLLRKQYRGLSRPKGPRYDSARTRMLVSVK